MKTRAIRCSARARWSLGAGVGVGRWRARASARRHLVRGTRDAGPTLLHRGGKGDALARSTPAVLAGCAGISMIPAARASWCAMTAPTAAMPGSRRSYATSASPFTVQKPCKSTQSCSEITYDHPRSPRFARLADTTYLTASAQGTPMLGVSQVGSPISQCCAHESVVATPSRRDLREKLAPKAAATGVDSEQKRLAVGKRWERSWRLPGFE